MKNTYVLGIYGKSNTGKTSLIVDLIKHFKNLDFKIASVKISDKKISFDNQKKDTSRHSNAGSDFVVLSSKSETDFIIKKSYPIKDIVKNISKFDNFDIIFIEGANDDETDKIRIGDVDKRKNTIITYYGDFLRTVNIILEKINKEYE